MVAMNQTRPSEGQLYPPTQGLAFNLYLEPAWLLDAVFGLLYT